MTLPSSKTNNNPGNYINFYCAIAGFECGLSTKAPDTLWGWFVNAPSTSKDKTPVTQYSDGTTKTIALYIGSDGKMRFEVDDAIKFTSTNTYSTIPGGNPTTSARFVVGAAQVVNDTSKQDEYIAAWRVYHNQVLVDNMQYLDSEKNWLPINTGNSTLGVFHMPSTPTPPQPHDYTINDQRGNSRFYASLKKQ